MDLRGASEDHSGDRTEKQEIAAMQAENEKSRPTGGFAVLGAGDGIRTRDINLGKVALYQLSYSRIHWSALITSARVGKVSEVVAKFFL
jgi:hypothetical protein